MEESQRKRGRKPRGNKRTKAQKEYDIAFCSNLFLKGYTYVEIANALNQDLRKRNLDYSISYQMVFYDMKQALIEWKNERLENVDEYITAELRKLDKMEVELWNAWEKSKAGKERIKKRKSARPNKPLTENEATHDWYGYDESMNETSAGNPRFFDLILNVQQRRAKLLGLEAPVKIELPNSKITIENEAPKYDVSAIPKDLLYKLADELQAAEHRKFMQSKQSE